MSIALMTMAWQTALPLNQKTALLALSDWANDDGASLHPSIYALSERLTCSERTAQRLMRELEADQWIAVVGNLNGGKPGATRRYRINVRKLRECARQEEARRDAARRQHRHVVVDEFNPFDTGDNQGAGRVTNAAGTGDANDTGVNLSGVTTATRTGDNQGTGRVTNQAETGDVDVTLTTIEPSIEPPKNLSPSASQPARKKVKADLVDEKETELQSACRETWKAYSQAYERRYGAKPVRNAQVNAKVKQFVQRIGYDESPDVAAFYVDRVSEAFVVRKVHDVGLLLAGAEGYRTQWATGVAMTGTRARQEDQTQANCDVADEAVAILMRRQAERAAGHGPAMGEA